MATGATNLPPVSAPAVQLPAARAAGHSRSWIDVGQPWSGLVARVRGGRFLIGLGGLAVVLGALSLLLPSTPSYDPWAWLIWGREIVHLNLHTTGGPSWKPLPVIFTSLFALLGGAQPFLWLVVARAGALMAVAMAFRLAFRLTAVLVGSMAAGRAGAARWRSALPSLMAGLIAAGSLLLSWGFITENALGYSEGLTAALVLIAVERFMDGAPRQSFVIGFLAALDRPELWFVWVPFGIYLYREHPEWRRLIVGLFALIPVLWLLPELWGSGQLLRGVARAQHPRADSAAFARCPVCTVFGKEAWTTLLNRVKLPGLLALLTTTAGLAMGARRSARSPRKPGRAWLMVIAAFGWIWWLGIALETQAGFSGNHRYLELGTAAVAISGGVAWGCAAGWLSGLTVRLRALAGWRPRTNVVAGAVLASSVFLAVPPWIGTYIAGVGSMGHELAYQARLRQDLVVAVQRAGGPRALLRCGRVMTEPFQVPMVAWMLHVGPDRVEGPPARLTQASRPGVILQTRAHPASALLPSPQQVAVWQRTGARYVQLAQVGAFTVLRRANC